MVMMWCTTISVLQQQTAAAAVAKASRGYTMAPNDTTHAGKKAGRHW
jgi:hypothetical protein